MLHCCKKNLQINICVMENCKQKVKFGLITFLYQFINLKQDRRDREKFYPHLKPLFWSGFFYMNVCAWPGEK